MSNWGKIYTTTWWGEGIYNTIGWGSAYPPEATANVVTFRDRVVADGGIIESLSCLATKINYMPSADEGRLVFDAYSLRVVTDSGLVEARTCTITDINELKSI